MCVNICHLGLIVVVSLQVACSRKGPKRTTQKELCAKLQHRAQKPACRSDVASSIEVKLSVAEHKRLGAFGKGLYNVSSHSVKRIEARAAVLAKAYTRYFGSASWRSRCQRAPGAKILDVMLKVCSKAECGGLGLCLLRVKRSFERLPIENRLSPIELARMPRGSGGALVPGSPIIAISSDAVILDGVPVVRLAKGRLPKDRKRAGLWGARRYRGGPHERLEELDSALAQKYPMPSKPQRRCAVLIPSPAVPMETVQSVVYTLRKAHFSCFQLAVRSAGDKAIVTGIRLSHGSRYYEPADPDSLEKKTDAWGRVYHRSLRKGTRGPVSLLLYKRKPNPRQHWPRLLDVGATVLKADPAEVDWQLGHCFKGLIEPLRRCYAQGLGLKADLAGEVKVRVKIKARSMTTHFSITSKKLPLDIKVLKSTLNEPGTMSCIGDVLTHLGSTSGTTHGCIGCGMSYHRIGCSAVVVLRFRRIAFTADMARTMLRKERAKLWRCYRYRGYAANPKLRGRVGLKVHIAADGKVGSVEIASTELKHAATESCLRKVVRKVVFPRPSAGTLVVTHDVTFEPPKIVPSPTVFVGAKGGILVKPCLGQSCRDDDALVVMPTGSGQPDFAAAGRALAKMERFYGESRSVTVGVYRTRTAADLYGALGAIGYGDKARKRLPVLLLMRY